ncbi:Uncharacterised protein [Shigella sonnei]|nr:Uncharacterised protein [Shigella sonnei]
MVNRHRQRRTQTAARFTDTFEFHRQIKVRFGQEVSPRAAWLPGFKFQTITHTTGVIFEDLACGGAERQFPQSRIFHPTGEAHQLGASIFTFRDVLIPLHAVSEDRRNVTQGFDVVDTGRFAPYAGGCREGGFRAWVSTTPFQGVD